MDRVLIVTENEKRRGQFSKLIAEHIKARFCYANTSGEAWRLMSENSFALVLIVAPLPDEFGVNLARTAAKTTAGVILLGKGYQMDEARQKLGSEGVMVFRSEMGRIFFGYTVELMLAVHRRLAEAAPQTEHLQRQIRDIRLVDRAKCMLIQYERMTEAESHKYIERLAMDNRISRRDAALQILAQYECED